MNKTATKLIMLLLCTSIIILVIVPPIAVESTQKYTQDRNPERNVVVYVDGKRIEFPHGQPYVDSNFRIMVPIRFVLEAIGAKIFWNQEHLQATIIKDNTIVTMTTDKPEYIVNGQEMLMDTAMVYSKELGTTFVPIRYVLEALQAEVNWRMENGNDVINVHSPAQQISVITKDQQSLKSAEVNLNPLYDQVNDVWHRLQATNNKLLSGSEFLELTAKELQIPNKFYANTDIEYFKVKPYTSENMKTDLNAFLKDFEFATEVPVLTYHHLLEQKNNNNYPANSAIINVEAFREQIELLHKNGFQTYGLDVLEQFINGEIKLPKKSVFITFDDGYLSNYVYGYPILKEHNYTATIFAITDMIRPIPETFNTSRINFISWQEINQHSDVFTIEAHSHNLHRLSNNLSHLITVPYNELINDMNESRKLLKSYINHDSVYFAYPYGQYNLQTIRALKETGYRLGFTNRPGTVRPHSDPYQINRFGIYPWTTIDNFKTYVGIE
ncbi:stalk domain-containing protein [Desulfuribacillus alkaliarsenatis]|uniref:NodB homology domain-containing protein n=1 Tax=Desulfuribacillus alkaliarsenatis TaxID=766136 RepID=A0A1E5G1U5_9FIRM|nr:stalk domain-containing protein [Desulfuribacillus alkaliarsenatis]OEF96802.1 hypothetical protein BHF68_06985 [Desulfuribacillus alkaliarsenatis]